MFKKRIFTLMIFFLGILILLSGCGQKIVDELQKYSVSGRIVDVSGNGISDVTLHFSDNNSIVKSTSDGRWSKDGLSGKVVITPVKAGYVFQPQSREATGSNNYMDFTGVPDGIILETKIVFTSSRDGNSEIYIMNADGTNQTRLTNNSSYDAYPSISLDGSKITFVSDRDGNYEIYIMNADGTNQTRLTNNSSRDSFPSLSPDANKIAFESERDGDCEVYVMNSDGSNQTRLTFHSLSDGCPSWSPDGNKIVFTSRRDGGHLNYIMNDDGSNQTRLKLNTSFDVCPNWSPDGNKITFQSWDGEYDEIHIINIDGSNQTRLTFDDSNNSWPFWSPDGSKIAFTSGRDGNSEIYIMNQDGTNQTRLTFNGGWDPSWSIGSVTPLPSNNDPIINNITASSTNIETNGTINISVDVYDPDNDPLSYSWSATGGSISGIGSSITYTAPNTAGTHSITLTVDDGRGGSATASIYINVSLPTLSGEIEGTVKDAVTNAFIQDVLVKVFDSNDYLIKSTYTDINGSFKLTLLSGDNYRIYLSKDGYLPIEYYNIEIIENSIVYLQTILQINDSYQGYGDVSGTIVNAFNGAGVSGLTISLREGFNSTAGTIVASTTTSSNGYYSFNNLPAGNYTAEVYGTGYITTYFTIYCLGGEQITEQNFSISPIISDGETRIVLTWGSSPNDLDSHLTGPIPGSQSDRFHVYWNNDSFSHSGSIYAELDRDDTSSYGPETITIYQQTDGIYRYSVHNFSDRSLTNSYSLAHSGAQVQVYRGGYLIAVFNVPADEGTLWTVFELDGSTGEIISINTMTYANSSASVQSVGIGDSDAYLIREIPEKY